MIKKSKKTARIGFLDVLRIFAFISVLLGHKFSTQINQLALDQSNHIAIRNIGIGLTAICHGGGTGVIVFFFISGYIITHVLQNESAFDFIIKRLFRIYPVYFFAVSFEEILGVLFHNQTLTESTIIIPRLLLIGDFFNTPYGLAGVEWTLRVEIIFYIFMATLKAFGVIKKANQLVLIYIITTLILGVIGPFPSGLFKGYASLYGPFLFIGSIIYYLEHRMISKPLSISVVSFIFIMHWTYIAKIQPNWKEYNFALYGLILFLSALKYRQVLENKNTFIRKLSDLTYTVYLFHNWLWIYLNYVIERIGFTDLPMNLQTMMLLFLFCYITHITIERYGINTGNRILILYKNRKINSYHEKTARNI